MKTLANARDKEEILRRLKTVRPASARRWGRMSAHQMICHLSDSFLAVTGQRHASPASGPLQRTLIKWIALYAPVNWPRGVPTRPEVDQEVGGTPPSDFAADLTQLEMLVEFVTTRKDCFGPTHPIFGPMSEAAWMRWAYLHMDHHLRQFGC
jgi:Protein of unknown function (DUF1569)